MRHRKNHRGLTNSRIYSKGKRFYFFSPDQIENPKSGKIAKWHPLCDVSKGEEKARELAKEILLHNKKQSGGKGDMPDHVEVYRLYVLKKREEDRPTEPARAAMFEKANREITRLLRAISSAFEDFNVDQPVAKDIADFVDQWEGQRMAEVYLSRLTMFFAWACRKGLREDNPCREVSVEKAKPKTRYIPHKEFHAARDALLENEQGNSIGGGEMVQCYVDLCYLLYQRTTDVRLLKETQIDDHEIKFTPTKTELTSGAKVSIPITQAIRNVLDRARGLTKIKSIYIIHKHDGSPYTPSGLRSAIDRACKRAGVPQGMTAKALRSKAATDAKKAGYSKQQIQVGLAHSSEETTDIYIKDEAAPLSELTLSLPPKE